MSKIIYDLIQRFEVENGVPRLVSTNIQVIQGGEDLMSLATSMLAQMGFYEKFEEKRTSQYIGYRLKNAGEGDKRYQLVLAQRKEGLCISIPQQIIDTYLLELNFSIYFFENLPELKNAVECEFSHSRLYWVRPIHENAFKQLTKAYSRILDDCLYGSFELYSEKTPNLTFDKKAIKKSLDSQYKQNQKIDLMNLHREHIKKHSLLNSLDASECCIKIGTDKLFPYTRQVCISSRELLKEFLDYFVKIIMEKQ